MRIRITGLYDVINYVIMTILCIVTIVILFIYGNFNDLQWGLKHWYLVLWQGICLALPIGGWWFVQNITINFSTDEVCAHYLVNYNKFDVRTNWYFYVSEVESAEVVKLSREEKRKFTSSKFLFNKYIKVTMRYGHEKYLYVSHYSERQIKEIIFLLTNKKLRMVDSNS